MVIMDVDQNKLEALTGKVLADIGGAFTLLLAYIGDQSGVYEVLDKLGPCNVNKLASEAEVDERYLLEWLSANAAAGYVTYHPDNETFSLSTEQAYVFTREGQPNCLQGFFQLIVAQYAEHEKALSTFKSGAGREWGDHHSCQFCGTDRFFKPGYMANLVTYWIPSLNGVEPKLKSGARVADIGCGHGSSTILMARAYPKSIFYGYDFHAPSIEEAKAKAQEAGVTNVHFKVAAAKDYAEKGLDLVCIFDALHDMGDPVGAAKHIKGSLNAEGTFMLVEPQAGDKLSDNLHLLGKIFYSASTTICTPASKAQEVGLALGAQAGQKRLTAVLKEAGFTDVNRASETPTNMVLEACF